METDCLMTAKAIAKKDFMIQQINKPRHIRKPVVVSKQSEASPPPAAASRPRPVLVESCGHSREKTANSKTVSTSRLKREKAQMASGRI